MAINKKPSIFNCHMMSEIHIDWEGPFSADDIKSKRHKITVAENHDKPEDGGLYQIYGNHPIYGQNTLLYIGQTAQKNSDSFSNRVLDHDDLVCSSCNDSGCNQDTGNKIYLGYIYCHKSTTRPEWQALIDYAEKLLIYAHIPAHNAQCIKGIKIDKEELKNDVIVYNWRHRAMLQNVISSYCYQDFEQIPNYMTFQCRMK